MASPIDDCPNPPCTDDPSPSKIGLLDTLWSVPIGDRYVGTNHIEVIDGVVYLSVGASIFAYDALSSEELWRWEDPDLGKHLSFNICRNGKTLILQNWSTIASVNLKTGATVKRYTEIEDGYNGAPRGALLGDHYYFVKERSNRSLAIIRRSHKDDLKNWEDLYVLKQGEDTGGSRPNIESYNLWVNPTNGDSVLVFQHRMSIPNRVDVVAFSLNSREILWRHNDINGSGNSNHQQMLVMNDKAYIMAGEVVIAYDMFSGEVVWKHYAHDLALRFMFHKFSYAESINAILVKGNSPRLYGLDPETGAKNLYIEEAGRYSLGAGSPVYHNGIIYYTTYAQFTAARAATGEILWEEDSSMSYNSGFNGDIGIDEENGLLFAADGYYLYAIRMYGE
ncbi:MAG: hypothetical protein EA411_01510 [Saprospirales bacterium]|nr:MAG: hypothetical protein EA411_01510 [Saprospirales bacterium]